VRGCFDEISERCLRRSCGSGKLLQVNTKLSESGEHAPEKCRCNQCGSETWHVVHHRQSLYREDEIDPRYPPLREEVTYKFCQCAGCEAITVVVETIGDGTNGEALVEFYPPRSSRRKPVWLNDFFILQA
jgi:hypothetical protein